MEERTQQHIFLNGQVVGCLRIQWHSMPPQIAIMIVLLLLARDSRKILMTKSSPPQKSSLVASSAGHIALLLGSPPVLSLSSTGARYLSSRAAGVVAGKVQQRPKSCFCWLILFDCEMNSDMGRNHKCFVPPSHFTTTTALPLHGPQPPAWGFLLYMGIDYFPGGNSHFLWHCCPGVDRQ